MEAYLENAKIATKCMICGESVPVYDPHDAKRICDNCRNAVMRMREIINDEPVMVNQTGIKMGQQINVLGLRKEKVRL